MAVVQVESSILGFFFLFGVEYLGGREEASDATERLFWFLPFCGWLSERKKEKRFLVYFIQTFVMIRHFCEYNNKIKHSSKHWIFPLSLDRCKVRATI